ncbi:MAG: segregation/condensation protein A [Candidatus Diapherotrites archaeon]|nr:segregation/condensation protein A [Candidatus Diapherotrites archaeon]
MELDELVDMIEKPTWKALLVNTVKSEGMDPWDIDVTMLASKYSDRIRQMRLRDFRIPANAVLASAILVRLKSDSWQLLPEQGAIADEPLEDYQSIGLFDGIPELEVAQRVTTRRVTLDELIQAVEHVMDKTRKKASRQRVPVKAMEITIGKKEDFQKVVNQVYSRVLERVDSQGMVLFSDLLVEKTRPEVVRTLLSLLHLANDGKLSVWQEKVFGDIFISLRDS